MSDIDYTSEIWRPVAIPEYQDSYEVSDHGRVRSVKFGKSKLLRPTVNRKGYYKVSLFQPKTAVKSPGVHRLVALTFIGPPPTEKHEVAHNDGVPSNNHVSNLRWATRRENHADMILHGTAKRGAAHYLTKLSDADISNIYKLRETGLRQREIAEQYGVTTQCINHILRGKSWGHLGNPVLTADNRGENTGIAKLKTADVLRIHELRSLGHSHRAIAGIFGVCRDNVSSILRGRSWSHLMPTSTP